MDFPFLPNLPESHFYAPDSRNSYAIRPGIKFWLMNAFFRSSRGNEL